MEIISLMQFPDLVNEVIKLTDKLMAMYGLSSPGEGFCNYLANVFKKHYGFLTFEQITQAFEYNSIGSLNSKLPRIGNNTDNKVKFTIPDITKVLKAYCQLKNIGQPVAEQKNTMSPEQIQEINNKWIKSFYNLFTTYRDTGERGPVYLKVYTCNYLVSIGALDKRELIAYGASDDLVFKAFDDVILSNKDLMDYIIAAQPKDDMPF